VKKSELIQSVKDGDKSFIEGNYRAALIHYLQPFKEGDMLIIICPNPYLKYMEKQDQS